MNDRTPRVVELEAERKRVLFEIDSLEHEIRRITNQLEDAEGTEKEDTDWWHRARDAKRHKERQRRVLVARSERLARKIGRVKPEARKAEAKESLREVLRTLFLVAKTSLVFYEDESQENETAFTDALDRLDQVVPGWDQDQAKREPRPVFKKVKMG